MPPFFNSVCWLAILDIIFSTRKLLFVRVRGFFEIKASVNYKTPLTTLKRNITSKNISAEQTDITLKLKPVFQDYLTVRFYL